MSVVCPLTNKSLNMRTALGSAFRLTNMNKRSNVTVHSQVCHKKKNHIIWVIKRSDLMKKICGEYVDCSTIKNSSTIIHKIMLYPSGKNSSQSCLSLDFHFKDLQENSFIEGDIYILGKDKDILLSEFSGHTGNLKEIDTFLHKHELSNYFINNILKIRFRINTISQTYKCISDKSEYQVRNSREIINFRRLIFNIEKYSDVILHLNSKIIKCHKFILASESEPLSILFRSCQRNILDMSMKSTALMEELIHFIYSGNIQSLQCNHICQMYIIADEFRVFNLKDICSLILCSNLSKENVPYIFELSMVYKDQYLIEACLNFVKKHDIKSLRETFVERSFNIRN